MIARPGPLPERSKATTSYVCEHCGGRFVEGWSDAEAQAEARRDFGYDAANAKDFARVCDDCYRAIMHFHRQRTGGDR